jgi:hypothetical protein
LSAESQMFLISNIHFAAPLGLAPPPPTPNLRHCSIELSERIDGRFAVSQTSLTSQKAASVNVLPLNAACAYVSSGTLGAQTAVLDTALLQYVYVNITGNCNRKAIWTGP